MSGETDANLPFDADRLIDGELAPDAAAAAVIELRASPDVAAAFGRHAAEAALTRSVLRARAAQADAASGAAVVELQPRRSVSVMPPRRFAIAAVFLGVALLGSLAGYFGSAWRVDQARAEFQAAAAAERAALHALVQEALERRKSGDTLAFRDDRDGHVKAAVTPTRTYKSVDGHWCREYVLEAKDALPTAAMRALACRDAEGRWVGAPANALEGA